MECSVLLLWTSISSSVNWEEDWTRWLLGFILAFVFFALVTDMDHVHVKAWGWGQADPRYPRQGTPLLAENSKKENAWDPGSWVDLFSPERSIFSWPPFRLAQSSGSRWEFQERSKTLNSVSKYSQIFRSVPLPTRIFQHSIVDITRFSASRLYFTTS